MPGGVLEYENVKQDVMKYEWENFCIKHVVCTKSIEV